MTEANRLMGISVAQASFLRDLDHHFQSIFGGNATPQVLHSMSLNTVNELPSGRCHRLLLQLAVHQDWASIPRVLSSAFPSPVQIRSIANFEDL